MDIFHPFHQWSHRAPTREEIATACNELQAEYDGCGVAIDKANIAGKIKAIIPRNKLQTFSLFIPIAATVIDSEACIYTKPPQRSFQVNGKPVGRKVLQHIEDLYQQMSFDAAMLCIERQAALQGTALVLPAIHSGTGEMSLITLYPSEKSLGVTSDDELPSLAAVVQYETTVNGEKVRNTWDTFSYRAVVGKGTNEKIIEDEEHGFPGQPWSVLRYNLNTSRFWAPFDGGLRSICRVRSLLLADAVHRSQVSMYELLVMSGFSPEEALASTKNMAAGKVISFENATDENGNPITGSKSVDFVSPKGIEPKAILDLWLDIWQHFLRTRHQTPRAFETSGASVSADAQKLADVALLNVQQSRKSFLTKFEADLWQRIKWESNRKNKSQIPDNVELIVDYQPDTHQYASLKERVEFYKFALTNNLMTTPEILRELKGELSKDEAEQRYNEIKEFNKESQTSDSNREEE